MFARLKLPLIRIVFISFSVLFLCIFSCDNGGSKDAVTEVFTINYDGNGAEYGNVPSSQKGDVKSAQAIQANIGNLAKNGYVFDGWNTIADGSGTNYSPGTAYKGSKNLILYAKWVALFNYQIISPGSPASSLDGIQRAPAASYAIITGLTERGRQLSDINIPEQIDGYMIASIGANAFKNNSKVSNITIPVTVTSIGDCAFAGCTAITDITIPANVTSIGNEAFSNCVCLTSLVMLGTTPPAMGDDVLADTVATISVPAAGVTAYMGDEGWNIYSSKIAGYSTEILTVTFDTKGGTSASNSFSIQVVPPAVTVRSLPANPVNPGYDFGGWFTEENGGGIEFTTSTVVTKNIKVYARWNSYSHTVTFNGQGSDSEPVPSSIKVISPATSTGSLPETLKRGGFYFGGWFTEVNGRGTEFTASTPVTGDITVYAYWTANPTYTVSFDSCGADTLADPAVKTVKSPATTVDVLPSEPVKKGYNFGGWNTNEDGTGDKFTTSTIVTDNIVVYAQWERYCFTVTFNGQGAIVDPTSMKVESPNTTITDLPDEPTKERYFFSGWFTEENGKGTEFTASTLVTGDIIVYAYWTEKPVYTVTFNSGNADTMADPSSMTVEPPATTIGTLPSEPERVGYTFGGWKTKEDGSGDDFTASTMVTENVTVYAKWIAVTYSITYKDQGGTDFSGTHGNNYPTTHTYGTSTALVSPTKENYDFDGWYTASDCSGVAVATLGAFAFKQNITLYAKWLQKQVPAVTYTVIFDSHDADTNAYPSSIEITSPAATVGTLPSEPIKEGYIFDGWNTKPDGTGPSFTASTVVTGNITVYAKWTGIFKYITTNGKITITGLTSLGETLSSITIPSTIDGLPVDSIGNLAFYECNNLKGNLTIPSSLSCIGDYAFYNCTGITGDLTIPSNVVKIGNYAFYGCTGLSGKLLISSGVETIGECSFYNCTGITGDLTIPSGVKEIGPLAFGNCTGFNGKLLISYGVKNIGAGAFNNCSGLTGNLTIPTSIITIGKGAFNNCSGLSGSLTIPSGITCIEEMVFSGCYSLTGNLTIPNTVTDIKLGAFQGCGFTGQLVIPSSVTDIGANAFSGCSGFTGNLIIPESVKSIGEFAFQNCWGFSGNLAIPSSIIIIEKGTFYYCSNISSITIPSSVTQIGSLVFSDCMNLELIKIENTVPPSFSGDSIPYLVIIEVPQSSVETYKSADGWLYYKDRIVGDGYSYTVTFDSQGADVAASPSSIEVTTPATTVESLPTPPIKKGYIFNGWNTKADGSGDDFTKNTVVSENITVYAMWGDLFVYKIENSAVTISGLTEMGKRQTELVIPETIEGYPVTTIESDKAALKYSVFNGCTGLTSVTLPNGLKTIGRYAFYERTKLTSITIPESVTSIDSGAFEGCSELTTVNYNAVNCTTYRESIFRLCDKFKTLIIGENVEIIPSYAFAACYKLVNLRIPDSVTTIKYSAFANCYNLSVLIIGDGVTDIEDYAFVACGLTEVTIGASVANIGKEAFIGNGDLTTVNFNAVNSTQMGDGSSVFSDCTSFTTLNIGNKVKQIPKYAFAYCKNLANVMIPKSVTSIGDYAFSGCSFSNIIIPDSVTNIGDYAFSGCSFSSVTIPDWVTNIGSYAFSNNTNLTILNIGENVQSISKGAFEGCRNLRDFIIPNSVISIGEKAFFGCKSLNKIIIPNGITEIKYDTFASCTNLESITIPNGVNSIWDPFSDCSKLTSITIPASVSEVYIYNCPKLNTALMQCTDPPGRGSSFSSCPNLKAIIVPASVVDKYKTSPYWYAYADIIVGYDE